LPRNSIPWYFLSCVCATQSNTQIYVDTEKAEEMKCIPGYSELVAVASTNHDVDISSIFTTDETATRFHACRSCPVALKENSLTCADPKHSQLWQISNNNSNLDESRNVLLLF